MICEKHPKYKGAKLGIRNKSCPSCNQIFQVVQQEREEKKRQKNIYTSLSTPNYKVDLAHILAETMTMMKYGIQAERFWSEASTTPQEVKSYFFNKLKMSHIWIGQKVWAANALKGLFYISVINQEIRESIPKIQVTVEESSCKKEEPNRDYKSIFDNDEPGKLNLFSGE